MAKDIIKRAQDRYKRDKAAWSEIYTAAKEDLHFLSDAEDAQWSSQDMARRKETGRPALTVDNLTQFVHQVANDIRMNTPTINVIPDGEGADEVAAEVFKGKIKAIEYNSNADTVYDTASLYSIKSSIGFIRVDHDYVSDTGFEQDLFIKRVINPFTIFLDSSSIEVDGSDAKHCHVLEEITVAEFKARYPKKDPVSFAPDGKSKICTKDDERIFISEYYEIQETERTIAAMPDGSIVDYSEDMEVQPISKPRVVKDRKVLRFTLSGSDVLEETTFPGKYIPIVPVYGEEAWEDGKRKLLSLIRKSKDAQRVKNLMTSVQMEALMKQPQSPWLAAAGAVEDFAEDWLDPAKALVLRYNTQDSAGNPLPPPERVQPAVISSGFFSFGREAIDDIKATMGLYNASIGQRSNETSGVAINQRKLEGDVATFHFGDNLVKSITQVGRILVFAIPEIIDTPRIIKTVSEEEDIKDVGVNGLRVKDQEQTIDLKKGRYSVRVVTGASFTTQRQETVAALTQMFSANPSMMQMFGDIYFKNSDYAGSQAMAKRAEKLLPPELKEDSEDAEKIQMQQALQQAQQQIEQLTQQVQAKQVNDEQKTQLEIMKLQIERETSAKEAELKTLELKIKEQELFLKRYELELQAQAVAATQIGQSSPIY